MSARDKLRMYGAGHELSVGDARVGAQFNGKGFGERADVVFGRVVDVLAGRCHPACNARVSILSDAMMIWEERLTANAGDLQHPSTTALDHIPAKQL